VDWDMKTYTVEWHTTGIVCTVSEHGTNREIGPRLDLVSTDRVSGNGKFDINDHSQLALAILADCFGNDDDRAVELHQWFKRECVALKTGNQWTITSDEIIRIVSRY